MKNTLSRKFKIFVTWLLVFGMVFSNMGAVAKADSVPPEKQKQYIFIKENESTTIIDDTGMYSKETNEDGLIANAEVKSASDMAELVSEPNQMISLKDCLYTLNPGTVSGTYQLTTKVGDTDVYLAPCISPNGYPNIPNTIVPINITISKTAEYGGKNYTAEYFYLKDSGFFRAEPRWLHFNSGKMLFDRVITFDSRFANECSMQLYVADDTALTSDIPGYRLITDENDITEGSKYLVIAVAKNGKRYALRPSVNTKQPKTHMALVHGPATAIKVTGVKAGKTSFSVGNREYVVTVLADSTKEVKLYTNVNSDTKKNTKTVEDVLGEAKSDQDADQNIVSYVTSPSAFNRDKDKAKARLAANQNDFTYSGNIIDLEDCLYNFEAVAGKDMTFRISNTTKGTTVYMKNYWTGPGRAQIPQFTKEKYGSSFESTTAIIVSKSTVENAVYLEDTAGKHVYFHRKKGQIHFDQSDCKSKKAEHPKTCSFLLYEKSDEDTSDSEIPGYKKLTEITNENLENHSFLIVAKATIDGVDSYYVLKPSSSVQKIEHVAKVVTPSKRSDYTFTAKKPGKTYMKVEGNRFMEVDGNTSLQPLATDIDLTIYCQLRFDAQGGTLSDGKDVIYTTTGEKLSLPTAAKDGYTFLGWFDRPEGGNQVSQDSIFDEALYNRISDDSIDEADKCKLYAQWTEGQEEKAPEMTLDQEYDIMLVPNGGVLNTTSISIKSGETKIIEEVPSRDGYTFDGWYTWANVKLDNNQITDYDYMRDGTVLIAKWNANKYQLTLNTNKGENSEKITKEVTSGEKLSLDEPAWDGHMFIGWFDKKQGESSAIKYENGSKVSFGKDTTLYAHWVENGAKDATLTLDANGGEIKISSLTGKVDGTIGIIPTPTREGYHFDG